ncbi:hypothetical protein BDN67DRAFT_980840 [Paxillus ammoniavirescens]|nr:hypothetical protein BDN67DRAFT_980840 [Paxillus ammoniavirescens]
MSWTSRWHSIGGRMLGVDLSDLSDLRSVDREKALTPEPPCNQDRKRAQPDSERQDDETKARTHAPPTPKETRKNQQSRHNIKEAKKHETPAPWHRPHTKTTQSQLEKSHQATETTRGGGPNIDRHDQCKRVESKTQHNTNEHNREHKDERDKQPKLQHARTMEQACTGSQAETPKQHQNDNTRRPPIIPSTKTDKKKTPEPAILAKPKRPPETDTTNHLSEQTKHAKTPKDEQPKQNLKGAPGQPK